MDDALYKLIIQANNATTTLNSLSKRITNVELFISMYIRKESLLSSQIEGTQASLEDLFDPSLENNA